MIFAFDLRLNLVGSAVIGQRRGELTGGCLGDRVWWLLDDSRGSFVGECQTIGPQIRLHQL